MVGFGKVAVFWRSLAIRMTSSSLVSPFVGALVFFLLFASQVHATIETRQVYIAYLGSLSETTTTDHYGLLREIVDTRFMKQNLLRSYKRSFNGFAASLTDEEHEKLAGARYYNFFRPNKNTSRDDIGHGSHTASTAAGRPVDANFYGIAGGIARGGVPSAKMAVYKACHGTNCYGVDLLHAFDDAIADGVDLISISVGGKYPNLESDPIAIGGFHASARGILVVQAAGNDGGKATIGSVAPWIFSVAASSTDRAIITKVTLGDGKTYIGKSVNSFNLHGTSLPIIYGDETRCHKDAARSCAKGCLEPSVVKDKIVMCNNYDGIDEVSTVGGLGVIAYASSSDVSYVVPIAASSLNGDDFNSIQSYYSSTRSPIAGILASEAINNTDAPHVASFSSRGPNPFIPDILKPDITAPGVEILAAYSPSVSPTNDKRSVPYSILSGTSMSCPHVTGAAAYVKSFHLDWSSSAIKSALMTTASRMDASKDQLAEFSYGAGHVDPRKAIDPGLVYEISTEDYINLLCNSGYNTAKLRQLFTVNSSCNGVNAPKDMNYPSMTVRVSGTSFSENFTRKVTNVGVQNSRYEVKTSTSSDYRIVVNPTILTFRALGETQSFEVSISGKINGYLVSAYIEWTDGVHTVRSPVVVYSNNSINEPIFSWAHSIGSNKIFYLFLAFLVNYI